MDTGMGNLAEISNDKAAELTAKNVRGVFYQGETVELKGHKYVVKCITKEGIQLRPIKD